MDLNKILEESRRKKQEEEEEYEGEKRDIEKKTGRMYRNKHELLRKSLIPATLKEYKEWLKGYLQDGGSITHVYDYNWEADDEWFVAVKDCDIPPLYGATSINVIVPRGVSVGYSHGLGHNNIYYMDGFRQAGGWVPIYSNISF